MVKKNPSLCFFSSPSSSLSAALSSHYYYYNYCCYCCSVPLCPPISPAHIQPNSWQPDKECLEKCFDARCPDRNSSKFCDDEVHCYWCLKDENNLLLHKPYCASSDSCFRGTELSATEKIHGKKGSLFLNYSTSIFHLLKPTPT